MPVEINYLGWDDEDGMRALFDSIHGYLKDGYSSHIKSGYLVCHLKHVRDPYPAVSYEFLAEDKDAPITKLNRIVFNNHWTYEHVGIYDWQTFDISPELASELHSVIERIPEYRLATSDILISGDYYEDILRVDTQPDVCFYRDWGSANFSAGKIFDECVYEIVRLGEAIANNTLQYRDYVEATLEPFRHLFRKQIVREKYQVNWSRPTSWNPKKLEQRDKVILADRQTLTAFLDVDLHDDLKHQLDFKFYLADFMRLMGLRNYFAPNVGKVFQKIAETNFRSWDADEQSAFHNYLGALMDYILVYFPSISMDVLTFIRGVQTIDADVERYVNHWKSKSGDVATMRHLSWTANHVLALYSEIGNDAIETLPDALRGWLREVYTDKSFVEWFDEYDRVRPFATEFDEAHTALEILIEAGL